MILAEDEKSDLSQVATSHLIRLIIIITVFPFVVQSFYDFDNTHLTEKILTNQFDMITFFFQVMPIQEGKGKFVSVLQKFPGGSYKITQTS